MTVRNSKVSLFSTVLLVAVMVLGIIFTQGRSVGTQRDVIESLDNAGTRSVKITIEANSGIDASLLNTLAAVKGVAWISGVGFPTDVTNGMVPQGNVIGLRTLYLPLSELKAAGVGDPERDLSVTGARQNGVFVSKKAMELLGLKMPAGYVRDRQGLEHGIVGEIKPAKQLSSLEPLLVSCVRLGKRHDKSIKEPLSNINVELDRSSQVDEFTTLFRSLISTEDAQKVRIETSQALAELRDIIDGKLFSSGKFIVAGILLLSSVLIAGLLTASILMRRREYGRQRALGATRGLVLALVLCEVAIESTLGGLLGAVIAYVVLAFAQTSQPSFAFYAATVFCSVLAAGCGALLPGVLASRRDPVQELRVP
jgi:putative ABC transport system permease protein